MLNTERVRNLLIPELRNPERKQATGALRRKGKGDCCLGVACDVSGLGWWKEVFDAFYYVVPWEDGTLESEVLDLPKAVMEFFGFPDIGGGYFRVEGDDGELHGAYLYEHNDMGVSFRKIADALEKECDRIDALGS